MNLEYQTLTSFRHHLQTHYFHATYPTPAPAAHPQCAPTLLRVWRYINHLLNLQMT